MADRAAGLPADTTTAAAQKLDDVVRPCMLLGLEGADFGSSPDMGAKRIGEWADFIRDEAAKIFGEIAAEAARQERQRIRDGIREHQRGHIARWLADLLEDAP